MYYEFKRLDAYSIIQVNKSQKVDVVHLHIAFSVGETDEQNQPLGSISKPRVKHSLKT